MVADGPRAWCGDRPAAARSRAAWSGSRGPGRGRCGLTALCPVPQGMSARLQKLKWSEREWETRRLCGCVCACTQLSHTHSRVLARHVNTRWRRARTLTHTPAHPPGSGPGGPRSAAFGLPPPSLCSNSGPCGPPSSPPHLSRPRKAALLSAWTAPNGNRTPCRACPWLSLGPAPPGAAPGERGLGSLTD